MIEPTETETTATLDAFIAAMLAIADEACDQPDLLRGARAPLRCAASTRYGQPEA